MLEQIIGFRYQKDAKTVVSFYGTTLCLEKADVRTRKIHSQKFRHIGYNIDPYGQSFFPNCISHLVHGMALLKTLQRPTLYI